MKTPKRSTRNSSGDNSRAVTVIEITDPTTVGDDIEVIDQDIVQLESKPLRGKRVIVRLGSSLVGYQSTNLAVRTRTRASRDLVAYVAFGPNAQGTFNGVTVGPDLLLAAEPGIAGEFVVGAGYESVSVFLPPAELKKHLEVRHRVNEFRVPQEIEILQSTPTAARSLFECGANICRTAEQQPELFDDHPISRASAHFELLETLLTALGSTVEYETTRSERTKRSHSRIVQVAEDYATTHIEERLSLTELCAAADVSERTLQYAFREIMGMTPIAFLTRLRLHRVRQALRKSRPEATTVSAEAMRWGFWHFGDFSRAYKACFSELPSDTLKSAQP